MGKSTGGVDAVHVSAGLAPTVGAFNVTSSLFHTSVTFVRRWFSEGRCKASLPCTH